MASNSKNLGELLNTTTTVSPAFVSDQDNTATGYFDLPNGTTAQRPSAASGMIRYNSTTSLAEYYDGATWKSIDSPPTVSSISPSVETDANANIVITGSGFSTNVTVKFVGADGTDYASPSVTRNSATQITATTPSTALTVANEPYDIVVTNTSSSLSGTLADALDAGGVPAFATSAGSLGSIFNGNRVISGTTLNASATDPDGDTITYSVTTGSLPAGLSISSSTGMITGTATAVGSNTTTTFTVSAATASDTSTRQFSITVSAPVITSYTSTGSGTFSVPTGLTTLDVLVVAAGGGSGVDNGGGGGGGGLVYRPDFPVTPGGSVSYSVGAQAPGGSQSGPWGGNPSLSSQDGGNSTFGTLTANGGGTGGSWGPEGPSGAAAGKGGGSGGGESRYSNSAAGTGNQPQRSGDSGTYGFGNPGGRAGTNAGGGGGGAGAVGQSSTNPAGGGGAGRAYSISGSSVSYAAGGGGGSQSNTNGQNGFGQSDNGSNGFAAANNRGGGGSGGSGGGSETTGRGAPGIVIVSY